MLVITIYKMSNGSRWYPVAKFDQDHQGLQTEQLRTLVPFQIVGCVSSTGFPQLVSRNSLKLSLKFSKSHKNSLDSAKFSILHLSTLNFSIMCSFAQILHKWPRNSWKIERNNHTTSIAKWFSYACVIVS